MYPLEWYSLRNLPRIKEVVNCLVKDPYLKHTQISNLTKIPRSTVTRIIKQLEKLGVLTRKSFQIANSKAGSSNVGYKYEISPVFITFLKHVNVHEKPSGFSPVHHPATDQTTHSTPSIDRNRFSNPEELEKWAKDGFFRIHGFQRKYVHTSTLSDILSKLPSTNYKYKIIRIGRNKSLKTPVVYIPATFRGKRYILQVHVKTNTMIVSLPNKQSISVPWDSFTPSVEQEVVDSIQTSLTPFLTELNIQAYDAGWVGRKKPLKPEVSYIDPDGIIRKIKLSENNAYIEGVGYWVDASLKESPELEFPDAEKASKFKEAVDKIATGEIYREIGDEIDQKLSKTNEQLKQELSNIIRETFTAAVESVAEEVVKMSYAGGMTPNQQITQIWKEISNMQKQIKDLMALVIMSQTDDEEVKAKLKERILKDLNLD